MRINPRIINRLVRMGLNIQAFFTVGILIIIVAIIFFKGFPHTNFAFIFSFPEDMGRHGGIFPSIVGTIQLALLSILFATPLGVPVRMISPGSNVRFVEMKLTTWWQSKMSWLVFEFWRN